jgi:integrase/recombinase XerC
MALIYIGGKGIFPLFIFFKIMYNLIMKNEELINKFLDYLKNEKNYSDKTIKSYEEDLNSFCIKINKDLLGISEEDIIKYLGVLKDDKLKKTSVSRKISSLKSFYKFINFKKIKENYNPTTYVLYPKREKKLPNYIEYNELEELIKSSFEGKNSERNNLIVELLYATGMRVSELVNIKLNDIDFNDQSIRVFGKGSKERIVYFGEYALDAMNKYIEGERSNTLCSKECEWLFPNKDGKNLTTRTIELIIEKLMNNVSIKSHVSPHTLRHTFATHMLNSGCDIRVVQELLGHENLITTEVYTHITSEELRNTYLKYHNRK